MLNPHSNHHLKIQVAGWPCWESRNVKANLCCNRTFMTIRHVTSGRNTGAHKEPLEKKIEKEVPLDEKTSDLLWQRSTNSSKGPNFSKEVVKI